MHFPCYSCTWFLLASLLKDPLFCLLLLHLIPQTGIQLRSCFQSILLFQRTELLSFCSPHSVHFRNISHVISFFQTEKIKWTIHLGWHLMLLHFLYIMLQIVLPFVREINQNFCPGSCCFLFVLLWILTVRLYLWPFHSEHICAL